MVNWKLVIMFVFFGMFGMLLTVIKYETYIIPKNYVCKSAFDTCYNSLGSCIDNFEGCLDNYGTLIEDYDNLLNEISYQDVNCDGTINCVDIAQTVYQCFKDKNYYVETCKQWDKENAHAFVKVWVNYMPSQMENIKCEPCLMDSYGRCIE